jgi:hypothetical protein
MHPVLERELEGPDWKQRTLPQRPVNGQRPYREPAPGRFVSPLLECVQFITSGKNTLTSTLRRRHHFVTKFHLDRFANDGEVFIFNRETGKTIRAGTKAIAVRKDLYRIDVPDLPLDALEIALSEIESAASKVFRDIENSHKIPQDVADRGADR